MVGPRMVMIVPLTRSFRYLMLLSSLTILILVIGTHVGAENTPPQVTIETPSEGAELGMAVVVSGTATDEEGFNTSSYVEMRWNDWEWFVLPSNPGGGV